MSHAAPLADEPLLSTVPTVDGWKVLPPAVLYAKVGQGGMGAVYRGRHIELEIDVAVKCLKPSLVAEDEQFEARFRREARLAAELTHENLVRLYELRRAFGLSYLILEFVDGETARDRVTRKVRLREEEAAAIVLGAARGLAKAHSHPDVIVHRDIKPENILVSRRGEVKVADLGIAKAMAVTGEFTFSTQGVIGTPQYMAPEQWDRAEEVGPATDVWALGSTLYFLLTGRSAIKNGTVQQVSFDICSRSYPDVRLERPDLAPGLIEILDRCVRRDPAERYRDANVLALAIERWLGDRAPSLFDGASGSTRDLNGVLSPPPLHALKRIRTSAAGATRLEPNPAEPGKVTDPPLHERPTRHHRIRWLIGTAVVLAGLNLSLLDWSEGGKEPGADPIGEHQRPGSELDSDQSADGIVDPDLDSEPAFPPKITIGEPQFAFGKRLITGETKLRISGIVDYPINRLVAISAGETPLAVELDMGGAFSTELALRRDSSTEVLLVHGDPGGGAEFRFQVVQDSTAPSIRMVSPVAGTAVGVESVDLRVELVEANPESLRVGSRDFQLSADGTWLLTGLGLPAEGPNAVHVEASDLAGRNSVLDLVIERDTRAPSLLERVPGGEVHSVPGGDVRVTLRFDEPIASAEVDGRTASVSGSMVAATFAAPPTDRTIAWVARDRLGHVARGSFPTRTAPPEPSARVPEGWDLIDATAGVQGWARRAREPKSGLTFVLIPPGRFRMGSLPAEVGRHMDEKAHEVELRAAYYIAECETSQAQYQSVMGTNPSVHKNPRMPVDSVDVAMARAFCLAIDCELPTEAEWEYAARAGGTGRYSWGDEEAGGEGKGNFSDQSLQATLDHEAPAWAFDDGFDAAAPVRWFESNAWGVHDMHGNVWEICEDLYVADYERLKGPDPVSREGSDPVIRGGAWDSPPWECRIAFRGRYPRDAESPVGTDVIGFRVVKRLK